MKWFPPEAGEDEVAPNLISAAAWVQEINPSNQPGNGSSTRCGGGGAQTLSWFCPT